MKTFAISGKHLERARLGSLLPFLSRPGFFPPSSHLAPIHKTRASWRAAGEIIDGSCRYTEREKRVHLRKTASSLKGHFNSSLHDQRKRERASSPKKGIQLRCARPEKEGFISDLTVTRLHDRRHLKATRRRLRSARRHDGLSPPLH
ncbi:hypothetical protein MRB53_014162 [Persea americana]|uniref:Uncharacterized protein n=1 Tax=Persea americana TaxID=3435 RepID=A0ACC2KAE3_PERAE|nr:hypothetical protein MRB53_014162 [Persea americana]